MQISRLTTNQIIILMNVVKTNDVEWSEVDFSKGKMQYPDGAFKFWMFDGSSIIVKIEEKELTLKKNSGIDQDRPSIMMFLPDPSWDLFRNLVGKRKGGLANRV